MKKVSFLKTMIVLLCGVVFGHYDGVDNVKKYLSVGYKWSAGQAKVISSQLNDFYEEQFSKADTNKDSQKGSLKSKTAKKEPNKKIYSKDWLHKKSIAESKRLNKKYPMAKISVVYVDAINTRYTLTTKSKHCLVTESFTGISAKHYRKCQRME